VDSTFLLKIASSILPREKLLAVTAVSPTYPDEELSYAKKIARKLKVRHLIIRTREDKDKRFTGNPPDRCYYCKKELFSRLKSVAKRYKLNFVLDASNFSDKKDYRPGARAKNELGVRSPLQEARLTKQDIRDLSKMMRLDTWDKPSLACLASRIPYGTKITPALLNKINKGEAYLRQLGFKQVRLRHYNGLCRIEVMPKDIAKLIAKRNLVIDKLQSLGYNYITVDLEGYRTGSLNLALNKKGP
jgi:uncharacterized protein